VYRCQETPAGEVSADPLLGIVIPLRNRRPKEYCSVFHTVQYVILSGMCQVSSQLDLAKTSLFGSHRRGAPGCACATTSCAQRPPAPSSRHTEPRSEASAVGGAEQRARTTRPNNAPERRPSTLLAAAQIGTSERLAGGNQARRRAARATTRSGELGQAIATVVTVLEEGHQRKAC
jgi:hypothetical protein